MTLFILQNWKLILRRNVDKLYICCISHGRPENVPIIEKLVGQPIHWLVSYGSEKAYKASGAMFVIESGNLCESRNYGLREAFKANKICIELSDDLTKIQILENKVVAEISFKDLMEKIVPLFEKAPFYLAGMSPTSNAYFVHKPISFKNFIVGDFIMVKPNELFFDENLNLKEDYDYTVQHIKKYGGVMRFNVVLPSFKHYSNKGGAVEIRTNEKEQEAIKYLMKKHPGFFRINKKRGNNEILINRL